jgi:DNA invertase Pin-like site-specific DNA recombinase
VGFNEMLARIRAGEANGIICESVDRLTRNVIEREMIRDLIKDGSLKEIRTLEGILDESSIKLPIALGLSNEEAKF